VVGFDTDPGRLGAFAEGGGEPVGSPGEVVSRADEVILCLPSTDALRRVVFGEGGVLAAGRPGVVLIETSTLPVPVKEEARRAVEAADMGMLDCPISGTGAMARRRDIAVYASGPTDLIERCRPIFEAVARSPHRVGDFGAGTRLKLISNLLVSVHTAAAAEALTLAARSGLDPTAVLPLLCDGSGTSRMLEVRGPMMAADAYPGNSSTVDVLFKDVEMILDFAAGVNCPVPLMAITATLLSAAQGQKLGSSDPAVLARVLGRLAGLESPPGRARPDPAADRRGSAA
jgi:putative dehydrogenase